MIVSEDNKNFFTLAMYCMCNTLNLKQYFSSEFWGSRWWNIAFDNKGGR